MLSHLQKVKYLQKNKHQRPWLQAWNDNNDFSFDMFFPSGEDHRMLKNENDA